MSRQSTSPSIVTNFQPCPDSSEPERGSVPNRMVDGESKTLATDFPGDVECIISKESQNETSVSDPAVDEVFPDRGDIVTGSSYVPSTAKSKATQNDTIYVTESLPLSFSLPAFDHFGSADISFEDVDDSTSRKKDITPEDNVKRELSDLREIAVSYLGSGHEFDHSQLQYQSWLEFESGFKQKLNDLFENFAEIFADHRDLSGIPQSQYQSWVEWECAFVKDLEDLLTLCRQCCSRYRNETCTRHLPYQSWLKRTIDSVHELSLDWEFTYRCCSSCRDTSSVGPLRYESWSEWEFALCQGLSTRSDMTRLFSVLVDMQSKVSSLNLQLLWDWSNHLASPVTSSNSIPASREEQAEDLQRTTNTPDEKIEYSTPDPWSAVDTRQHNSSLTGFTPQDPLSQGRDQGKHRRRSECDRETIGETQRPPKRAKVAVSQDPSETQPRTYVSTTVCGNAQAVVGDVNHHTHHHYHVLETQVDQTDSREQQQKEFVSSIVAAANKHGINVPGIPPVKDPDAVSRWVREVFQANMCATTIWDGEIAIVPSSHGSSLQHVELAAVEEADNDHDRIERQRSNNLQYFTMSFV